jgi:hypothetical protein
VGEGSEKKQAQKMISASGRALKSEALITRERILFTASVAKKT